ncbi:VaFE repeat-containing surface-anchored protein [Pseudoclavibacter soli]|uniref:VaFE repeat-containing surface-anchored protein n=1 Tax=Pseudoclavibacter soli TaxID=452623 RepID=UPI00041C3506|nr:VaFE repeat-containing surface-anchored protein [Pseudoclavibacter soli]
MTSTKTQSVLNRLSSRFGRTTRRALAAIGIGAVAASSLLLPIQAANAAAGTGDEAYGAQYGSGNGYWVGSYRLADGTIVWCAMDVSKAGPHDDSSLSWGDWVQTNSAAGFTNAGGVNISGALYNQLAYIVGTWGSTSDNNEARAVYRAEHLIYENATGIDTEPRGNWKYNTNDVAARADQMIAEAQANAGTAITDASFNGKPDSSGSISDTRVRSWTLPNISSSSDVSSITVTATISGPGVFDNGTQTLTYQGNQSPTVPVTATGNGKYTVTVNADVPGGYTLKIAYPSKSTGQVMMALGAPSVGHIQAAGDPHLADYNFQPIATSESDTYEVGTEAEDAKLVGEKLKDKVNVAIDTSDSTVGNVWAKRVVNGQITPVNVIYNVDWYYNETQLPESAEIPDDAVLFDSTTFTANGEGSYDVTSTKPADKEGYYYPVISVVKDDQAADVQTYIRGDWTAAFHDENEEEIIPWTPEVSTETSGVADGTISDTLVVTGANPNRELTVVSKLYLTDAAAVEGGTDTAPADAELVATVETTIKGDGTYETESVDVPWTRILDWAGEKSRYESASENPYDQADRLANLSWPNLYWQESIAGTQDTTPWTGKHLQPDETYDLTRPSVTTQTTKAVSIPATVHDTATVTGDVPVANSTNDISTLLGFNLYRFDNSVDGAAQPVCQTPQFTQEARVIDRNGTHVSDETTIDQLGTYGWVEKLTFVFGGEHTSASDVARNTIDVHEGECGAVEETVVTTGEITPTIATQATTDNAADNKVVPLTGATVTDTVSYENLTPGTQYHLTGKLVTGDGADTGITGEAVFTPETASGTAKVTFTLSADDATKLAGSKLVVFEQLYDASAPESPVAVHEDINDDNQTITVAEGPKIATQATTDNAADNKVVPLTGATVTDTVSYENLTPGTEYRLTGKLVTGDGADTGITGEAVFTPETASGTAKVTFTLSADDATKLAGSKLVVFEQLYDASAPESPVAVHEDINDDNQTITVATPLAVTGASATLWTLGVAGALAAAAGAILLARRRLN